MNNRKIVYFNSAPGYRDVGGTDESFTITRSSSIFPLVPRSAKLVQANIPYTWNNITTGNNKFNIIEPGPVVLPITITPGRYDANSLAVVVKAAMDAASGNTYTVAYSSTTGRYTFSTGVNFQLDFTPADSIAEALGFEVDTITAAATSVTSTGIALLLPDLEVIVTSNLVLGSDNGVIPWFPDSATAPAGVFAVIPISACPGGIIRYDSPDDMPLLSVLQSDFSRLRFSTDSQTVSFTLSLQFMSGIPLDLNGAHWSGQIVFEF